ncbi:MAG: dienelactone hydrolase family protein, partial [Deltaproteobacteria bacterium]|nr:dienelactone hydrolase family protein [Deltaproteobacteria bacterium]
MAHLPHDRADAQTVHVENHGGPVNSLDRDRKVSDSGAFIEFLSSTPDVKGKRFGATGYCMGGNASLTAAGAFPDRF